MRDGRQADCTGTSCDSCVIVDEELYETESDNYDLEEVSLNGDCLEITFFASGCSGDTWEVDLVDLDLVIINNMPHRSIKLHLQNDELCEAYIRKSLSFDLRELQVNDYNKVNLNLKDWNEQIEYVY